MGKRSSQKSKVILHLGGEWLTLKVRIWRKSLLNGIARIRLGKVADRQGRHTSHEVRKRGVVTSRRERLLIGAVGSLNLKGKIKKKG